ncbi:FAD-binding protein [Aeromonas hydrophila]|uniref:electron transfer flavoprotein subunit alpha/FixB family protein n=1 Tax=Aeromonas hydrophila TaxID=644 RepID=UPI0005CF0E8B|nr:FAD-binding protein [Aeromonas hydrophila]AJQ54909.1 electron transfer flavoprotein subunit beta [Aeromonas hydrophila]AWA06367.1 electron transfer flavoprotein subunit alpha [Aeromonas hydrophila subsp. hydrophila]EIS3742684.1 FAD-binding protein [Aeromonas hydrophila]MBL0670182.1 FAD-binding protein [Aeromonas hydrophila]MCC0183876.1 FAD-binding protein [Aeromonas hydrophila]
MSVLIIAEHHQGQLADNVARLVTAGSQLGGEVHLLLLGQGLTEAGEQAAALQGVSRVLLAEHPMLAEGLSDGVDPLLAHIARDYQHCLMAASTQGKDLLPRVAARLGVEMLSEVTGIESGDTFLRPIYAGNAVARVASSAPIKVLTIRPTAFAKAASGGQAEVERLPVSEVACRTRLIERRAVRSARPELAAARVVVSGGRALGSKAQFALIEALADKLGGAVGASRAAVDAGFVANDLQVGQTGKVVAPELYIAVGISGAIQHLAGMKESKVIVAINKDSEAPIFQVADYGLVGDLFTLLPELTAKL